MLLIATDEAGYGPKLGPLVVAASVWQLPADSVRGVSIDSLQPLSRPLQLPGLPRLSVADSKTVFKPNQRDGLLGLETIVWAAFQWAHPTTSPIKLGDFLQTTAAVDAALLRRVPWFSGSALDGPFPVSERLAGIDVNRLAHSMIEHWSAAGARLLDIQQRVLDAKRFNQACQNGINKAQLLSETTAQLVVDIVQRHPGSEVAVYSDRHGGRAYYGSLLQHFFSEAALRIIAESRIESRYLLELPKRQIDWRFTVKGDAFAPVSLASMVAKYTRERLMGRFNEYWQLKHEGPLRATAGYPSDASRFLADIKATIRNQNIQVDDLVRQR